MSALPDNELDLDKLFLPAWAQEPSSDKYSKYEGDLDDRGDHRRDRRGPRPAGPGGRRDDNRPRGDRRGGPRPDGPGRGRPQGHGQDRGPQRRPERERREAPVPLPDLNVSLIPDEKGVESLSRQIKISGRAYPLFDIAQMILQKPERHVVNFAVKKNAEGQPVQPLFVCALDETLWLSEADAVDHVLRKHFSTFYQTEKTATEPPKGKYTFVAQCGMSGVILGPPNHHDYQNQLRKLHGERFSRLPFDVYKSRVKIVRDEEVVKKWVDDQSWKTEYVVLNQPEPTKLASMEDVEKHFREIHKDIIIKPVDSYKLNGAVARNLRSPDLVRLVRSVWEDQRRFPLQIATVLSQQFASRGLQFFKVNKTVTHVCVARPHHLDLAASPVSEGIRKIVEYINSHPKCTRRQMVESIAPSPVPTGEPVNSEGQTPPADQSSAPTPEQTAVIADLHWLIHQGHVIEFANGVLETAKKPLPRPPRPEPKTPAPATDTAPAPSGAEATPAPETAESADETSIETLAEAPAGEVETPVTPESATEAAAVTPPAEEAAGTDEPAATTSDDTALADKAPSHQG